MILSYLGYISIGMAFALEDWKFEMSCHPHNTQLQPIPM
jgi:hypothetical protein